MRCGAKDSTSQGKAVSLEQSTAPEEGLSLTIDVSLLRLWYVQGPRVFPGLIVVTWRLILTSAFEFHRVPCPLEPSPPNIAWTRSGDDRAPA
jgi:hypothetical protein